MIGIGKRPPATGKLDVKNQGIFMRYNPVHLSHRRILTDEQRTVLHAMAGACPIGRFFDDNRHYEEWMVDFVYTSAKIEGNTYDRIDTDNLLRFGITAGSKRYSDAKMLVNLREGFSIVMQADAKTTLDEEYLYALHKVLMTELLPASQQGIVRSSPVTIGASTYRPLSDPLKLKEELKALFVENERYSDPFERAIHLHCNLAYLQFFHDGNKRTARLMQTATLVQSGITPLFFRDTLIDQYQRSTVTYYETGGYEPYVAFFTKNYGIVAAQMLDQEEIEFSAAIRQGIVSNELSGPT